MVAYEKQNVLDVNMNVYGEELDWSVTGRLTAYSSRLSRHPYTVQNWNTT